MNGKQENEKITKYLNPYGGRHPTEKNNEVTEYILANLEQTKAFGKKILEFEN